MPVAPPQEMPRAPAGSRSRSRSASRQMSGHSPKIEGFRNKDLGYDKGYIMTLNPKLLNSKLTTMMIVSQRGCGVLGAGFD